MSKTDDSLHAMRHSAAHIMANAVQHLWPSAKFGVGPVIDDGFYYDIDLDGDIKLSDKDFSQIEAEMKKIISADEPFEQFDMDIDKAIEWAVQTDQPYKVELLQDLKRSRDYNMKDLDAVELGIATDRPKRNKEESHFIGMVTLQISAGGLTLNQLVKSRPLNCCEWLGLIGGGLRPIRRCSVFMDWPFPTKMS